MNTAPNNEERFWQLLAKKLSADAGEQELNELEGILLQNPEWRLYADMLSQMWQQENRRGGTINTDAAYVKHLLKYKDELVMNNDEEVTATDIMDIIIKEGRSPVLKKFMYPVIASMLIVSVIAYYIFAVNNKPDTTKDTAAQISSVSTKNGNRSKIVLPDGTQVWLNSGSKIDYNNIAFNKTLREVTLIGEAFFDVVKNPDKPFIVHCGNMQVRVKGTAFNVKAYPGEKNIETSLIRGLVEVTLDNHPGEKFILHPSEKIILANEALTPEQSSANVSKDGLTKGNEPLVTLQKINYLPKDSIAEETSWLYNKLVFRSMSFRDLAVLLERRYDVHISFADPSLESLTFTGIFSTETIEQALDALTITAPFNYEINDNNIKIIP